MVHGGAIGWGSWTRCLQFRPELDGVVDHLHVASTASGLALHVAPNVNLHNGEVLHVSVSGFPPGKAFLSECASVADVSGEGCGAQLAAQPFVEIEDGSGTQSFTAADQAATMPLTPRPSVSCTNQCVLVATSGVPASGTQHIQTATLTLVS